MFFLSCCFLSECLCKSPFNSPKKESETNPENEPDAESTVRNRRHNETACDSTPNEGEPFWKPLVLFIPLRLGLTTMNMVYENTLKVRFIIILSSKNQLLIGICWFLKGNSNIIFCWLLIKYH